MEKRMQVSNRTTAQLKTEYLKQEKSLKELAALHCLSITKIRSLLLKEKVKLRKTGTHNYFTSEGRKVSDLHSGIIKSYKTGKSLRKVAAEFGVSYQTVSNILVTHNESRRGKGSYGKLTEQQKTTICEQYDTTNIRKLANTFDVSVATILKTLKASGVEVTHGRKYKLNQKAFDNLDTASAYWLGFLFARGNIKSQNHFDVYFHDNMKEIVKKFRSFIQSTQPFLAVNLKSKNNNKEYTLNRLAISSTKLVTRLSQLGVDKVSHIKYPKFITKQGLDKDFITGYFEGCGQLKNNQPEPYIQLRSNMEFLAAINKVITKNTEGRLKYEIVSSEFNPIYGRLRYTGKDNVSKVKMFIGIGIGSK